MIGVQIAKRIIIEELNQYLMKDRRLMVTAQTISSETYTNQQDLYGGSIVEQEK